MAAWEEGEGEEEEEGEEEGHFSGSLFLFEFFFCCVLIAFVIGAFLRSLRAGGEGGNVAPSLGRFRNRADNADPTNGPYQPIHRPLMII